MIKILLVLFRFPILIVHMIIGLTILLFFPRDSSNLKPIHHKISFLWMKGLVYIFGINIIIKGNIDYKAHAYVSNHISFFDIIVLNSMIPSNFVAKSEIKKWPVIGHLSSKTGTIFIRRGDHDDIDRVVSMMRQYILKNKSIIFFPEGRIGNGIKISKFHSKLFNCIENTTNNIQPIFIRYPLSYPNNIKSDSSICWSDKSQTLFKISMRCLSRYSTNVIVSFRKPIHAKGLDSYTLAKETNNSVLECEDELKVVSD